MAEGSVVFEYSKYNEEQIIESTTFELMDNIILEVACTKSADEVELRMVDKTNETQITGAISLNNLIGVIRALNQIKKQLS